MYPSHSTTRRRRSTGRRHTAPCTCDAVIALVAKQKSVPLRLFTERRRSKLPIARARQLAMYLSHVVLGRTLMEIGEAFGRDRTTVSYACALIEDMRDDPVFDAEVTGLERQIEAAMGAAEAIEHAA